VTGLYDISAVTGHPAYPDTEIGMASQGERTLVHEIIEMRDLESADSTVVDETETETDTETETRTLDVVNEQRLHAQRDIEFRMLALTSCVS
jgi:hypothetical protein